jgi:hypothetical protein
MNATLMNAFRATIVCLCLAGMAAAAAGQDKAKAELWREWAIFASDEDVSIRAVAFATKGLTVAAAQNNGKVHLWDALTGRDEAVFMARELGTIHAVHFDTEGQRLLAAGETGLLAWDVASGKRVVEHFWKTAAAAGAVFRPDGKALARTSQDGAVDVWSVTDGKRLQVLEDGPHAPWLALAFSADGSKFAAGSTDGSIVLWNMANGKRLAELQPAGGLIVRALAFSPDGKQLASARGREAVALWNLATHKLDKKLPAGGPPYHALAFNPQGSALAAGSAGGALWLWETSTGKEMAVFKGHAGLVFALAFAPDGRMLATGSYDATVKLFDSHRGLKLPDVKLEKAELDALFKDLSSDNDLKASRAVLALSAAASQSLPALKAMLRQGSPPDLKAIPKLIADLKSDQFALRDKATRKLAAMGPSVRPELRPYLKMPLELEAKRRIEKLLADLGDAGFTASDRLLTERAIVILERIGSNEARQVLTGVLYGVPTETLIDQAQAALERLK